MTSIFILILMNKRLKNVYLKCSKFHNTSDDLIIRKGLKGSRK